MSIRSPEGDLSSESNEDSAGLLGEKHTVALFIAAQRAVIDGTVGQIEGFAVYVPHATMMASIFLKRRHPSIDFDDPRNQAIIQKEVERQVGLRYRQRMFQQYKYLFETGQNLEDIDLNEIGGGWTVTPKES